MRAELLALALLAGCEREPPADDAAPAAHEAAPPAPRAEEDAVIREPAVAGSWYPSSARAARRAIAEMTPADAPSGCAAPPLALSLPHAGWRFSGPTAMRAVAELRGCPVRRVWVLGVAHRVPLRGIGLYRVDAFRTPLGELPLDRGVLERLAERPGFGWLDPARPGAGDMGEHSIEIELPLLESALGAFELVPLLVGDLDADAIRRAADAIRAELGPGDLVVASGDMTHYGPNYGYVPFRDEVERRLDELDHRVLAHLLDPDPDGLGAVLAETGATVCGRRTFALLAALLQGRARGTELAYSSSGRVTGDWTNSVGYAAVRYDGEPWDGRGPAVGAARLVSPETGEALRRLAERVLEHWFRTGEVLEVDPDELPPDASRVLGAFVTLEERGRLRGCIGEIEPRRAAWRAVVDHALDAALRDPRFPPVTADELPEIEVEVTLLGPSRPIPSADRFIVGRHGVVVTLGARRATFLPQVAPEQGWDRATTLAHLARKAGIPPAMIPQARLDVYEAQVVRPPEH